MKRQSQDKTLELAALHSPRRVAVPVLVRDGKPCMAGSMPPAFSAPYNVNPFAYTSSYSTMGSPLQGVSQTAGYATQAQYQQGIRTW